MLFASSTNAVNDDSSVNMIVDDVEYEVELENNLTAKDFLDLLPLEVKMDDLNSNKIYISLNSTIKSNPLKVNQINRRFDAIR